MTNGTVLVASPSAIGRQPEASGSSVPAWPARLQENSRLIAPTACVDVMPTGLSSTIQPCTSRFSRRNCLDFCFATGITGACGSAGEFVLGHSLVLVAPEVALYRGCSQKLLDPFRFVESFVDAEANFRSKF